MLVYNHIPVPLSSRNLATNAVDHPALRDHPATLRGHAAERPLPVPEKFVPVSPPLPKQNNKTIPPSPPKIICDKMNSVNYHRIGFLGEVNALSGALNHG
jgi:hypothetical protein